jgi:hypothetical protein
VRVVLRGVIKAQRRWWWPAMLGGRGAAACKHRALRHAAPCSSGRYNRHDSDNVCDAITNSVADAT